MIAAARNTPQRKQWLNAQALALLAGYAAELVVLDDGRPALVVTRGACTRCLESLKAAEAWLDELTSIS